MSKPLRHILTIASDAGSAFLSAVLLFAAAVGVVEYFGPGMAASAVAPQVVAALAALCLLIAVLLPAAPRRGWFGIIGNAMAATCATAFAGWAAWRYLAEVPERLWLTVAVTGAVALLFAGAAVRVMGDE